MKKYLALAFYIFTPLEKPEEEMKKMKQFFKNRDVSGRIYLSREGINGQMSGLNEDAQAFINWFRADPRFKDVPFKIHATTENIFPRMTIKLREELVAIGESADPANRGEYLSPEQWAETLENEEIFLLDVRNDYEWKIGHFEGAHLPPLECFRDFPAYADKLKRELDPKTKVLMYCTGGIRCELYSALMKKRGFENVYQLEGGVINYGQNQGDKHWKGKLFVFDDRMAIPIDHKESVEPIALCIYCKKPNDDYYNCANMDCNTLFLSCKDCIQAQKGTCCEACKEAPRVRPYDARMGNKPFGRKHLIKQEFS